MLPVGRVDCHLLPRILSTNSGTTDWSSRILRLRTPPSASRPPPLSGGLSGRACEPDNPHHARRTALLQADAFTPRCIRGTTLLQPVSLRGSKCFPGGVRGGAQKPFDPTNLGQQETCLLGPRQQVGPGTARSKRRPPQRFPRLPPYVLKSLRGSRLTRFLPVSSRNSISMRSKRISSMN